MNELILGIDGGGSKTIVVQADRFGNVLDARHGRGTNPIDDPDWVQVLVNLLEPFASRPIAGVAAALPAYGEVDTLSSAQERAVRGVFPGAKVRLLNDVDGAQIGAFAGASGTLILSGTGSMAWARDASGRSHRSGGWGEVIGDEGSAHWIGRRLLGAVSKALDGRAEMTALAPAVYDELGADLAQGMNGLEGWVAHLKSPRAQIAALAPIASRLAERGDRAALAIIEDAAHELALHVAAIESRAKFHGEWSYAGGAFASGPLLAAVTRHIGRAPAAPKLPPIGGALLAAAQHLGWPITAEFVERLAVALRREPAKTPDLQLTT
jgi:N-acetylglucosamine kinase-like BadF-type ATPase